MQHRETLLGSLHCQEFIFSPLTRGGTHLLGLNGVSFKWMLLCVSLFGVLPVGCCNCSVVSVDNDKCSNDG